MGRRRSAAGVGLLTEFIPVVGIDVSLAENATQRPHRNLGFLRHNGGVYVAAGTAHKLDVAALLAGLDEAGRFKAALDFAERLGLKPPQSQPRSFVPLEAVLHAAVRNAARSLP